MHTCFSEYSVCPSLIYLLDQVYRSFIHAGITLHVDIKTSRIRGPIFEPFRSVCY